MSKATTSSASVATSAELIERLATLEAMVTNLVTVLSAAPAAAPAAPAAPAAAPAAPLFPAMTRQELARLSPQQRMAYMTACRNQYFGKSGGATPGGVFGVVGGFVASQVADIRTAATHTMNVYATERMQYQIASGEC